VKRLKELEDVPYGLTPTQLEQIPVRPFVNASAAKQVTCVIFVIFSLLIVQMFCMFVRTQERRSNPITALVNASSHCVLC